MSTILKALRRLEQERTAVGEGRPLREEVATPSPAAPTAGRSWLPAAAALGLGLLVGGGIFGLLSFAVAPEEPAAVAAAGTATPPSAAAPLVAPEPARPTFSSPKPSPEPASEAPRPPDEAFASNVEVVAREKPAPRIADAEPIQPHRPEKPGAHRPIERSSAAARARAAALQERLGAVGRLRSRELEQEAARRTVAAAPQALPEPQKEAEAPPAPPTPVAAEPAPPSPAAAPAEPGAPPAPAAGETPVPPPPTATPTTAPQSEAAPMPSLAVQRTEWHPLADRRRAWLIVDGESEPRRVVEGDVVEGMLVSAIEPSGIVFERDGEALRRGVGEN